MKKILLTLVIATAFFNCFSQNTFPSSGNVGIGTTSPNTLLDVYNSANTSTTILRISGTAEAYGDYTGVLLGAGGLKGRGKGGMLFEPYGTTYGFGSLNFAVNQSAGEGDATLADVKMTISGSGNVGIGDINPAYKLSVNARNNTSSATSLLHGQYYGISVSSEQTAAPYYVLDVRGGTTSAGGSGNSLFYVRADGNIGMGTTSPDQKLTVNGTIHSTSVLVNTSIPTPDYVFESDYKLPTLSEIKTYTDKNHHLPDVPAAAEMEKNGINLGEMNITLLKKVEELTLYLIEQNKQLIKQNTKLTDQQKTNQSQQRQINELIKSLDILNHKKQ
ncbi:hypothetical protein [Mucilaginibacter sp. OK098]|uniref:hypothetical protein n=1 Tax=Mucilaginibacter sp. OK098 TaxID=1855297 RepID=UPI00091972C5|nr:hypothetical protein [Mucilaginibacter sp. OK098]SHN07639.1 hypothetical protein SAMN05216524_10551 [Mucilaginibacter sp. OK098]